MMKIAIGKQRTNRLFEGRNTKRGQSLVEFALTLPVMLIILAGTLEVANVLTIYNRVQTSAREGARFGAMGGDNVDTMQVVTQSNKISLVQADDRMKVWIMRPTLEIIGTNWKWKDATGTSGATTWGPLGATPATVACMFPSGCTDVDSMPLTAVKVLNEMKTSNTSYTGLHGAKFVVVVVAYETDLLLNLPFFTRNGGRFPMWSYAVMRTETVTSDDKEGCTAFPLALEYEWVKNAKMNDLIPPKQPNGEYTKTLGINNPDPSKPGNGTFSSTELGYLAWNTTWDAGPDLHANTKICNDIPGLEYLTGANCPYYRGGLMWPGNSAMLPHGYIDPMEGPSDTKMNVDDWVLANTAPSLIAQGNERLREHSEKVGRTLPIIVYQYAPPDLGLDANPRNTTTYDGSTGYMYKIHRFAKVQVVALKPAGGPEDNWIVLKFMGWLDTCGQKNE